MTTIKKAIIFDMDGTLWDSAQQVAESWNIVFDKYGGKYHITGKDMQSYMGLPMDEIFNRLMPDCDKELRQKIVDEVEPFENQYLSVHCGALYDGLEDTLKKLKDMGYVLMIATNAQDGYVQSFLESSNLGKYFDDYEMFGRTGKQKNENIELLIMRNMIDKAVYVGDTLWDHKATTAASLPFIHAAYGFGVDNTAEYKINSITELPDLVKTIL